VSCFCIGQQVEAGRVSDCHRSIHNLVAEYRPHTLWTDTTPSLVQCVNAPDLPVQHPLRLGPFSLSPHSHNPTVPSHQKHMRWLSRRDTYTKWHTSSSSWLPSQRHLLRHPTEQLESRAIEHERDVVLREPQLEADF
jgi:hypothetical protein